MKELNEWERLVNDMVSDLSQVEQEVKVPRKLSVAIARLRLAVMVLIERSPRWKCKNLRKMLSEYK